MVVGLKHNGTCKTHIVHESGDSEQQALNYIIFAYNC